jgi:hypothetical protein
MSQKRDMGRPVSSSRPEPQDRAARGAVVQLSVEDLGVEAGAEGAAGAGEVFEAGSLDFEASFVSAGFDSEEESDDAPELFGA